MECHATILAGTVSPGLQPSSLPRRYLESQHAMLIPVYPTLAIRPPVKSAHPSSFFSQRSDSSFETELAQRDWEPGRLPSSSRKSSLTSCGQLSALLFSWPQGSCNRCLLLYLFHQAVSSWAAGHSPLPFCLWPGQPALKCGVHLAVAALEPSLWEL